MSIKVGIIGSGPAGMAAAIYLKRSGITPVILEKSAPGGQMINTMKIENYLGFNAINGAELSLKMFNQIQFQGIEYKNFDVKEIKKEKHKFIVSNFKENLVFDKMIIATGKKRRKLELENEDKFNNISYCAICDGNFYKDKIVAVVGGGNSAVTEAIYLSNICKKVYLIVRNEIRAESDLVNQLKQNVEIIKGKVIKKLIGDDYLEKIVLDDETKITLSALFISIGGIPNTEFLTFNIEMSEDYIKVDKKMATSQKGLYACGDVIEKDYYQIATAINDGVIAALAISEERK